MNAKQALLLTVTGLIFSVPAAIAGPRHDKSDIGQPGANQAVDRDVYIQMGDMFFEPASIAVKEGETVRFFIKNEGSLLHEFNIGRPDDHVAHQKEMAAMFQSGTLSSQRVHAMSNMGHAMGGMKMVGMEHDDPNSVLVEPGSTAELLWTFSKANGLEFACNVPGHYQSGMHGKVNIRIN